MQKICLVIPCYNEFERFSSQPILDYCEKNINLDICLVNDGSTDQTIELLRKVHIVDKNRFHLLDLSNNVGKAEAVRQGINYLLKKTNRYDYLGYIDADLSAPITEVNHLLSFCNGNFTHNLIMGSRVKRMGAKIERSVARHYLGRAFATVSGILLKLPFYDTQCGLKLIKSESCIVIFGTPFLSKWLFDVEIIARISKQYGMDIAKKEILEVPLNNWIEVDGSKIKLRDMFVVPIQLIRIYFAYK